MMNQNSLFEKIEVQIHNYNKDFKKKSTSVKCLCNSKRYKKLFHFDRYIQISPTVVCKDCGLIYSSPRLKNNFIKEYYTSDLYRLLYDNNKIFLQDKNSINYEKVKEIYASDYKNRFNLYDRFDSIIQYKKNLNILEIGTGQSFDLLSFKKHGKLFGLDFSKILCKFGESMGISMIQGGTEELVKFNTKFDIIILSHVVEHFTDFKLEINNIIQYATNDCIFYIEVPCMDYKYNLDQIQNAHTYYFTKNTLLKYLSELNLIPLKTGIADNIHIYGLFKLSKEKKEIYKYENEYEKIISKHKKFKKEFYNKYIINIYFRYFLKKILGRNAVKIIRRILNNKD